MARPSSYRVLKSCGNCAHLCTYMPPKDEGDEVSFCVQAKELIPTSELAKWDHAKIKEVALNGLCDKHRMRMIGVSYVI